MEINMVAKDKKTFITYIAIVSAILIILNIVSRNIFFRWDLTENKMYSLSDSSKSIVKKIDDRFGKKNCSNYFKKISKQIME